MINLTHYARPLTNERVEKSLAPVLMDEIIPGAPLIVTFSFYTANQMPPFDFYGRTKKLESLLGRRFNRLLIRDLSLLWYQKPLPFVGNNAVEIAQLIRQAEACTGAPTTYVWGQSMGAYGALMTAMHLDASRTQVIAFGPLSFFNTEQAKRYEDFRWYPVMEAVEQTGSSLCADLAADLAQKTDLPKTQIVYGMQDEVQYPGKNIDVIHAKRLAVSKKITLHEYAEAPHAVGLYLEQQGVIDTLLTTWMDL